MESLVPERESERAGGPNVRSRVRVYYIKQINSKLNVPSVPSAPREREKRERESERARKGGGSECDLERERREREGGECVDRSLRCKNAQDLLPGLTY